MAPRIPLRIVVIGAAGFGKSQLARELSQKYSTLKVFPSLMDFLDFNSNSSEETESKFDALFAQDWVVLFDSRTHVPQRLLQDATFVFESKEKFRFQIENKTDFESPFGDTYTTQNNLIWKKNNFSFYS